MLTATLVKREDLELSKTDMGNLLRSWREAIGFSQEEMGQAINVDQTYIAKLETGKSAGSPETLVKLALYHKKDPGLLLRELAKTKLQDLPAKDAYPKHINELAARIAKFNNGDVEFIKRVVDFIENKNSQEHDRQIEAKYDALLQQEAAMTEESQSQKTDRHAGKRKDIDSEGGVRSRMRPKQEQPKPADEKESARQKDNDSQKVS